jgi:RNA polymerase sigma factor (TIGR02999 family)
VVANIAWQGQRWTTDTFLTPVLLRYEDIRVDHPASGELTELLRSWVGGDPEALATAIELAYPQLRRVARACLVRERPDHTMQATALVHEAYLRLGDLGRIDWQNRAQFYSIAAKIMRRILVDHARSQRCWKRGGRMRRVDLHEELAVSLEHNAEVVRLDQALKDLARFDSRKADVVEMRYFGGLTCAEIASVLGISSQTVDRDWSLAKAWLVREMILSKPTGEGQARIQAGNVTASNVSSE